MAKVIGIDLATTNSVVAGRPRAGRHPEPGGTAARRHPCSLLPRTRENDLAKLREVRDRLLRAAQALTAAASRPGSSAASSQKAQDSAVVDAEVVEDQ